jgi:alkylation response protein AidB-like acyl-CoA dehydrogenase
VGTSGLDGRVEGILDLVRERAAGIDDARRIDDDVVAAVRGTGLNRALLPVELGGVDTPLREYCDAVERIAAVDGSTGWCAGIGSGSNIFGGYMEQIAAKEVYADPDAPNASMFAPFGNARRNGSDHHVLTGRWPFTSNCLHSEWIGVGAFFWEGDEVDMIPRLVFLRASDVTIEDTWDALGLCGTGSHHTSVEDVEVDRARSAAFTEEPWAEGTLFRLPLFCVLAPALGIVPLGIARGALDEIARLTREGRGATRGQLADDPTSMAAFAAASAQLHAARAGLDAACDELWEIAARGEPIGRPLQAKTMMAVNYGCEVAVDVASTAHRLGGGAAAYANSPLLRALRDVQTARQHVMFSQGGRVVLGKALAGIDVFEPPFIV